MVILNENYLILKYEAQANMLIQTWTGYSTSQNFREGILKSLDFMKKNKVSRLLTDIRQQGIVKEEDTAWLAKMIVPQMVITGLQKQAIIFPEQFFTQKSLSNYENEQPKGLKVDVFRDIFTARGWLLGN